MYRFSGMSPRAMGASNSVPWCENVPPNQCIKPSEYNAVMKKVKADCAAYKQLRNQARGLLGVRGLGVMCSSYAYRADVMLSNLDQYDPCYVEKLPPCLVTDPPVVPDLPPAVRNEPVPDPPEDVGDDDNKMFMVGGIFAAVLLAGGGYAVFKSRKKKKKGGKKR